MYTELKNFIGNNEAEFRRLLKELCLIPAPSHFENERAKYIIKVLESYGIYEATIDEALNVIY